jgi:hypothetical protein
MPRTPPLRRALRCHTPHCCQTCNRKCTLHGGDGNPDQKRGLQCADVDTMCGAMLAGCSAARVRARRREGLLSGRHASEGQ